jgi:hypothetical protein
VTRPTGTRPTGSGQPASSRDELVARYRWLVDVELPAAAGAGRWVVVNDHCFGRILLDHAVGGRWYDHLDRRARVPAHRQLSDAQLADAVAMAEQVLAEGDGLLRRLDAQSLTWRGKRPKPAR